MAEQSAAALVRRFVAEVLNKHQLPAIDELFAPDTRATAGDHLETAAELKQRLQVYLTAFPDLQVTVDQLLAGDTEVMIRWTARGTHTGPLTGLPAAMVVREPLHDQDSVLRIPIHVYPTGRGVRFQGVSSFRVEAGKITWYWLLTDDLSLLRQLGALPIVTSSDRPGSIS